MAGIHQVTAISGKATRNLNFYTHIIGLRLVKKTVNFDDPGTYHLYYGDQFGHPGTILTFFPWEHASPGRAGVGLTQETAFRIPAGSIGYWAHRFIEKGVAHQALQKCFGEPVLSFSDPDGMSLAGAEAEQGWDGSDIPAEHAIRGFHGVTLLLDDADRTEAVLRDVLEFKDVDRDGSLARYRAGEAIGSIVVLPINLIGRLQPMIHNDVREAKGFLAGYLGQGSVHHIVRALDRALGRVVGRARAEAAQHVRGPASRGARRSVASVPCRGPWAVAGEVEIWNVQPNRFAAARVPRGHI